MLSEFAVSKPLKSFNQVHMDTEETLIDSIDAVLLFPGPKGVPGQLHLASRSIYFQPSESRLALVRFKFSDEFTFSETCLEKTLDQFEQSPLTEKLSQFWKDVWFVLFKKFDQRPKVQSELRNSLINSGISHIDLTSGPKTVFCMKSSKLVVFDRDPPKGYMVYHLHNQFLFLVDGFIVQRDSLSGPLGLSHLSAQNQVARVLSSGNSELLSYFDKYFANALDENLFYTLRIKKRPSPEKELNEFRLFRFGSILKKLAQHLKEDPIVEKLKEVRFQVFKESVRQFGMALFEPDLSVSRLGIAKGRNKSDIMVARAKDFQRNVEFLNFKLTLQHFRESSSHFNVLLTPDFPISAPKPMSTRTCDPKGLLQAQKKGQHHRQHRPKPGQNETDELFPVALQRPSPGPPSVFA